MLWPQAQMKNYYWWLKLLHKPTSAKKTPQLQAIILPSSSRKIGEPPRWCHKGPYMLQLHWVLVLATMICVHVAWLLESLPVEHWHEEVIHKSTTHTKGNIDSSQKIYAYMYIDSPVPDNHHHFHHKHFLATNYAAVSSIKQGKQNWRDLVPKPQPSKLFRGILWIILEAASKAPPAPRKGWNRLYFTPIIWPSEGAFSLFQYLRIGGGFNCDSIKSWKVVNIHLKISSGNNLVNKWTTNKL